MTKSIISSLLFGVDMPEQTGRVVRFGEMEPDIALATGSMEERVLKCIEKFEPISVSDIVKAIGSRVILPLLRGFRSSVKQPWPAAVLG